ncbi:hypothetical protein ACH5RR_005769 [Cinchona calisaya]|uniref:Flavin-containing monooxygenase n=1 Tax=Cinchona calisaya TaxID=153742 RepID=A0ABD3AMF3_9GENT
MEKRVAIIGAGLSGLLACKYALAKGFHPTIFEAQDCVGGLWNHTIESAKLQNAKLDFYFSDFPWPSSVQEMFPHNSQVLNYIQSYAQHFGLLPYIKFKSKVIDLDFVGVSNEELQIWDLWGGNGQPFGSKGKWNVKVEHIEDNSIKEYVVEFVILCIGRFSGLSCIPEFPQDHGPEVFGGKVLHSMEYSDMDNAKAADLIKGKKIAIIGSNKSAVDLADECARVNGAENPCTMVQRTVHWMLPSVYIWGVRFDFLYFNRLAELLVHKPSEGLLQSALAFTLSPLRWGIAKFVESYIRWKLPLKKYKMIPAQGFLQDMSSCQILTLSPNFYDKVEEGSIVLKKSKSIGFCREGLIIDGEAQPLKADVVILTTGYRGDQKLKNMFTSPTFQNYMLGPSSSTMSLYRQIVHPRIPQLAVIGYSESVNNLYTIEMKCRWLANFLDQTFQLPSIKEMEKDVLEWDKYMKRYAGKYYRRSCIGALHIWYNDQLCKDIGCNPRRKKGFFSELIEPYGPADYIELTQS